MITLLIKKKWFELIRFGVKKEEYREIKHYYITRFLKEMKFPKSYYKDKNSINWFIAELQKDLPLFTSNIFVCFKNGYSKDAPTMVCKCKLRAGTGKEEWGAEPEKKYFILDIVEIR